MKATYLKGGVLKKVEMLLMKHFEGNFAWRLAPQNRCRKQQCEDQSPKHQNAAQKYQNAAQKYQNATQKYHNTARKYQNAVKTR